MYTEYGLRVLLELWETDRASRIALAYSNLDELVRQLGQYQPWVRTTTEALGPLLNECDVAALVIDPDDSEDLTARWTAEKLDTLTEVNDGMAAGRSR